MKYTYYLVIPILLFFCSGCSNSVEYSEEFMNKTSGRYLYNDDNLIEVYYKKNALYLNWKGGEIKPVALAENEFFVPDMYRKLHFITQPSTGKFYLSKIPESQDSEVTYDYLKVPKNYLTPSMHLKAGNFDEALQGYLAIKKKDSTSPFINEWDINNIGYQYLRDKDYDKAVEVFKLNAALHPNSYNVFDSLAEGYLKAGDSAKAYENYKLAFKSNQRNQRALRFIEQYESKNNIN